MGPNRWCHGRWISRLGRRSSRAGLLPLVLTMGCNQPEQAQTPRQTAAQPAACRLEPGSVTTIEELPARLNEISGLAVSADGKLLGHADEVGRFFEIDPETLQVGAEVLLQGSPRDDFEGIAVTPEGPALMSSAGRLYVVAPPAENGDSANGDTVAEFRRLDTGLGAACELEGLAYDSRAKVLLFPCKTAKSSRYRDGVVVFRWSLETQRPAQPAQYVVPSSMVRRLVKVARFRATAADFDPETGHLLVLSSEPAAVIELGSDGRALRGIRLPPRNHPRAEGVALLGRRLFIADEGAGRRGTLTSYTCAP